MNYNNQSLIKYLIEDQPLRRWARQTITKNGGSKQEADHHFVDAVQLLWERLDQGMDIQQPEAFIRMILMKNWQGKSVAAINQLERPFSSKDKTAQITSWNQQVVKKERLRRIWMLSGSIALIGMLLALLTYHFYVAPFF